MGFFAGLNAEKYDRQYSDRQLIGRMIDYFKPQAKRFVWVSILTVLIASIGAALPIIVSHIVDILKNQPMLQADRPVRPGVDGHRRLHVGIQLGPSQSGDPRRG